MKKVQEHAIVFALLAMQAVSSAQAEPLNCNAREASALPDGSCAAASKVRSYQQFYNSQGQRAPYVMPLRTVPSYGGVTPRLRRNNQYLLPTTTGPRNFLPPTSTSSIDITVAELPPRRPPDSPDAPETEEKPTGVRGQEE